MKTETEIKAEIKSLEAEQMNAVNEANFCNQQHNDLITRINVLSGKIAALKELFDTENETAEKPPDDKAEKSK